jgi:hypothetical protein
MNTTSKRSLRNEQHKDNELRTVHIQDGEDMNEPDNATATKNIQRLLEIQADLKYRMAENISFSRPILKHGENAIVFPNTINVIQGQAGVHKSRVAETICSAILSKPDIENHLGFSKNPLDYFHLLYADTERNLKDQFPYALQQIVTKAGYNKEDPPANFSFISLLEIDRSERFMVLREFIEYQRSITDYHLLIVLDVTTDCIMDFNKPEHTMQLIDLMNRAVNKSNCTFLCIIHENPGSEKARGHLGTEIMNKSSTVMQVGFVKQDSKATDLIELKFLKTRTTKRPASIYCKYSDTLKGLALADASEVSEKVNYRKQKSAAEDVAETLAVYFEGVESLSSSSLLEKLCKEFGSKNDAMRKRLTAIVMDEIPIQINGQTYKMIKVKHSREIYFKIVPIEAGEIVEMTEEGSKPKADA